MPQISVIIPAFNSERTIEETVNSVLQQTFTDFELIIINDGSTDSTLNVLNQIQDSRIRLFSHENSGVAASRNRGIRQAVGQYLAFLDADDLWVPDKLTEQLQALQHNPEAAIAYSWVNYIDEASQFVRKGWHKVYNGDVYPELLLKCFLENGSNPLIRAKAIEQVGGFDASISPAEDWDLYIRLAKHYHFICVPKVHILYRISPTSASANLKRMERAGRRMIEKAFSTAPVELQPIKRKTLADFYSYLFDKGLMNQPSSGDGWVALYCLWICYKNNPLHLRKIRKKLILKAVIAAFRPN